MRDRNASCLAAILLLSAAMSRGQTGAQLSGQVRDPSGAAVAGAGVTVIHLNSGLRRAAESGEDGMFFVSSLPAGEYKITVRRTSFRTVARLGVVLGTDDATRVDFDLQIGGMQEVVTVEGGSRTINTEDASSGVLLAGEMATRLPISGSTLQGLIALAPGVIATPATLGEAGQFSVNGQRPNANYFVTDGVSVNSGIGGAGLPGQFSGGTLPSMTALGTLQGLAVISEVREVQVKTSTFAPEFGRMPGAQFLVNTRSGSNEYHGDVLHTFRGQQLSIADPFARKAGLDEAPLRMNDLNFGLGGPLQENTMFFFASGEFLRLRQPSAWRAPAPSKRVRDSAGSSTLALLDAFARPQSDLSGLFGESTMQTSWPGRVSAGSFRIDRSIGNTALLFARYHDTDSTNKVGLMQTSESSFGNRSFTAGITHNPSATITNDIRLNFARTHVDSNWVPGLATTSTLPAVQALFDPTLLPRQLYGLSVGGLGQVIWSGPATSRQGQLQLTDTVAIASGRHQLRLGIDYLRLTPSRPASLSTAVAHYNSLDDLLARATPQTAYANVPSGSSLIEIASAFVQDTWSVNERLNLTYGARWEYMPPPASRIAPVTTGGPVTTPGPGQGGDASGGGGLPTFPGPAPLPYTTTPDWSSRFGRVAPRVGAAYRLHPPRSLVLRAGAGIFYDLGFASTIDPLNSVPFNSFRESFTTGPNSFSTGPVFGFASDLRIPYSWQWNVTLEGMLPGGGILSAGWIGAEGRNLLRREGLTPPGFGSADLILATSNGVSSFQSFQTHYRHRLAGGWEGIASYNWSHSIDNGSWDSGIYQVGGTVDPSRDRGPSNFDARHSFTGGFSYALPSSTLPRFARGWSIHGLGRFRTGFPIDVRTSDNPFGFGFDNAPRPDLVPGAPIWLEDSRVLGRRRLNPAAFALPVRGQQGSLGRNALRGRSAGQIDAALERQFVLRGGSALRLRVQTYNVLNSLSVADPVRTLSNPLFGEPASLSSLMFGTGRPTSGITPAFQSGGPRTVEISVGWRF